MFNFPFLPALLNWEPEQKGNVEFSEINGPVDELSPLDADGIFLRDGASNIDLISFPLRASGRMEAGFIFAFTPLPPMPPPPVPLREFITKRKIFQN